MLVLLAGGLFLGLVANRVYAMQNEGVGDGDLADSDGGSAVDDIFGAIDDFSLQNLGVRIPVGTNWSDDLTGRGAAYKNMLRAAEIKNGIPQNMLARLAWQESRFREDIISGRTVSRAGAVGIMQIVPRWHPGVNALNPSAAIDYAGAFLASLHKKFGSWELALKSYNWGAGNVSAWLRGEKTQPVETQLYSSQILSDLGMT